MLNDNRVRLFVVIGGVAVVIFAFWLHWYNSPEQKLQRCVDADRKDYYSTSKAQWLHNQGADPPLTLFIMDCDQKLGIQPGHEIQ